MLTGHRQLTAPWSRYRLHHCCVCFFKMHTFIIPFPVGITWTAKRKAWGTSESTKPVESYGRRSLSTGKTCPGTTSLWWPRRLVGTQVAFHKLNVYKWASKCATPAAVCLLLCEGADVGFFSGAEFLATLAPFLLPTDSQFYILESAKTAWELEDVLVLTQCSLWNSTFDVVVELRHH